MYLKRAKNATKEREVTGNSTGEYKRVDFIRKDKKTSHYNCPRTTKKGKEKKKMIITSIFPIILMVLYFAACVVYLINKDYNHSLYWFGAMIINISVILMK